MPLQYDPTKIKYGFACEPSEIDVFPDGAEQEHKDSCDVTKMLRDIDRGILVRGNPAPPVYGYDDTTMDSVTHRIQKEKLERELFKSAKSVELTEEEMKLIPKNIQKKFGFKIKKSKIVEKTNDDLNDDKNKPQKNDKNIKPEKKVDPSGVEKGDGPPSSSQ